MLIKKYVMGFVGVQMLLSLAHAQSEDVLLASDAYMPQVPPVSRVAAIYLTLKNVTQSPLVLNGVSTAIARNASFHQNIEVDGLVTMKHLSGIKIAPNESIVFSPGCKHIMLSGLQKSPIPETFTILLNFENQESQLVEVKIRRPMNESDQ